jgi:glucosyl-3-phosphoglycerate synthase
VAAPATAIGSIRLATAGTVGDHGGVSPDPIRSFHRDEFALDELIRLKGSQRISVCLPARNEEETVGGIVSLVRRRLVEDVPLVDELVVMDDQSTDETAAVAAEAGATVVSTSDVLAHLAKGPGKGQAMWKSLHVTTGDLVVWCDADIRDFDTRFVTGVLGPLLTDQHVGFVKGFYERPLGDADSGGGRVTELLARPVISLLFPHLAPVLQPLAGEYGGRRHLLAQVPFASGYGVELGLLVDLAARFGVGILAQVDLGARTHRNRALDELGPQAAAILHAALRRAAPELVADAAPLLRPGSEPVEIDGDEHPPLAEVWGEEPTPRAPDA